MLSTSKLQLEIVYKGFYKFVQIPFLFAPDDITIQNHFTLPHY